MPYHSGALGMQIMSARCNATYISNSLFPESIKHYIRPAEFYALRP